MNLLGLSFIKVILMQNEGVGEDVAEQACQGRLAAGRRPADADDDGFSIRHGCLFSFDAGNLCRKSKDEEKRVVSCCPAW